MRTTAEPLSSDTDHLHRRIEELEDRLAEARRDNADTALRDAIETMPEGFALFDAEDRLVLFNNRYRDEIWSPIADILKPGQSFRTIVEETIRRGLWEDVEQDTAALLQDALDRHHNVPTTAEVRIPDGRWIRMTKRRTASGGVVAVYADISEIRQREKSVTESEERHRRLMATLPDAVVIHSGGKIAYVNPAAITMFGADSHTQLVGRSSSELVHPDNLKFDVERTQQVLAGKSALPPVEQKRLRLDGSTVDVETRSAFIMWNGKPALLGVIRDLTQRKNTEAALRESERRFSAFSGHVPGAVYQRVLHPDGTIEFPYISEGVFGTHGLTADEVMRDPDKLIGLIDPETRKATMAALNRSARELTPLDIEVRNIRPDGRAIWVRSIAHVHRRPDGAAVWEGLFVEITDRKLAEERADQSRGRLRESEERYRRLVELSPDSIYVHVGGLIAFVNSAGARLYGATTPDEMIGRKTLDLVHPEYRDMVARRQRSTLSGSGTSLIEQRRLRLDGSEFWATVAGVPMTWEGQPAALVVTRDITDAKIARTRLQEAKDAAEFANRTKSEFLANMSHELRTPLNAVIGFSEIMKDEMFGPMANANYRGYSKDIHESGTHLLGVINDILDLSKVEAGKLTPHFSIVDPRDAIESSIRIVKGRSEAQHVRITARFADVVPPIRADERMLKQILMNLLSNAVKFTPVGGTIDVEVHEAAGRLEITVRDTGIGIAEEDIPTVMAPFGQVEGILTRKHEGTGLGLPLTRSLVELHGGEIRLDSEIGAGTTVTIRLPRA